MTLDLGEVIALLLRDTFLALPPSGRIDPIKSFKNA